MWSDRYYYLTIISDFELSKHCDTVRLLTYLLTFSDLRQTSDFTFENTEGIPFIQLRLLNIKTLDNRSTKDTADHRTNLIEIVCAKGDLRDFDLLKNIFIKIASFLNWDLIDEHTDDGQENFIVWTPKKNLPFTAL